MAAGLVFVFLVTTACPSGPSAAEYASSVCSSLDRWSVGIRSELDQLDAALEDVPPAADRRRVLDNVVQEAISLSQQIAANLRETGEPDVPNGEIIATAVINVFRSLTRRLQGTREALKDVSVDSPEAFAHAIVYAVDRIEADFTAALRSVEFRGSPELQAEFRNVAECKALTESSPALEAGT